MDCITLLTLSAGIALQWVLFAIGARQLLRQVWKPALAAEGPLAAVVLVALTVVAPALNSSPLWIFQIAVAGIELTGLAYLLTHGRTAAAFVRSHAIACTVTFVNFGFWFWLLSDLDGLPSFHDGIAHTVYYLRMVENGQPLLHLNSVSLTELFGPGQLRFYPGGSHALVAMFDGWLPPRWFTPAQVLQTWLVLLAAGVPLLAYAIARALFPARSLWVYGAVLVAAFTYYRFPVWQIPSGGFSRHCALFVLFPLIAELVRTAPPTWLRRLLWVAGPIATFLLHPGGFGLFVVTMLWVEWNERRTLRSVSVDGICGALGLVATLWLVRSTGSDAHFTGNIAGVADASLYGQLKTSVLLIASIFDDFSNAAVAPLSARELLIYTTVVVSFLAAGRKIASARVLWFPWFLFASLVGILLLALLPWSFAQLIPQLFYNHPDRTAEVYYVAMVIVWTVAAVFLYERRHSRGGRCAIGLLFVLATVDTVKGLRFFANHVTEYIAHYDSPRHSNSGDTVRYLRAMTQPNAVVIADPFVLDSIESRSLRRSLFLYSECPAGSTGENCENRKLFLSHLKAAVDDRWLHPIEETCLTFVTPMGRPFYWLTKRAGAVDKPCADLRKIATLNGYDLFRLGLP
jgi:hypothetical protein